MVCRGLAYASQRDAVLAMDRHHALVRERGDVIVEQPYAYFCVEGHWHYSLTAERRGGWLDGDEYDAHTPEAFRRDC